MQLKLEIIERIHLKEYGFFSFEINMGNNLSYKYGQKLLDIAKKSTMDAIKTASKRAIQKTAKVTGDLIGNKIANNQTSVLKKSSAENFKKSYSDDEIETPKKDTYFQKKNNKVLMN